MGSHGSSLRWLLQCQVALNAVAHSHTHTRKADNETVCTPYILKTDYTGTVDHCSCKKCECCVCEGWSEYVGVVLIGLCPSCSQLAEANVIVDLCTLLLASGTTH